MPVYCPHEDCGLEMWTYDRHLLTCKRGHKMSKDHVLPAIPRQSRATHIVVKRPEWWQHPLIGWGVAALLLVAQLIEVLT